MLNFFRRKPKLDPSAAPHFVDPGAAGRAMRDAAGLPSAPLKTRPGSAATYFRPGQSGNPLGRPPSDPDARNLREARRIAARMYRTAFSDHMASFGEKRAAAIEAGHRDSAPEVQSVLEGIQCGRELERGRRG